MFNSVALDVVIGLIFVYLLYSLLATIIMEIIATWFSLRASTLKYAIARMLDDGSGTTVLSTAFYNHPLIKYLGENSRKSKPSYLNTGSFSKIFIDLLRSDAIQPGEDPKAYIQKTLDTGQISWGNSPAVPINPETLQYLKSIWVDAQGDVAKFQEKLESWFNETMERSSGWYKKKAQAWLFGIGLVIAIAFNVDTFMIVNKLQKDPKLREQLIQQADAFLKAHPNLEKELQQTKEENKQKVAQGMSEDTSRVKKALAVKNLDSLARIDYEKNKSRRDSLMAKADSLIKTDIAKVNGVLGMGLQSFSCKGCWCSCLPKAILGWCLTALALSLGAPFWFDMLNKLMKLRGSVTSSSGSGGTATDQKTQKGPTINPKG